MGLDVRAFKNIGLVDDPKVSEVDGLMQPYGGHFKEQLGELVEGAYYSYEDSSWFCAMGYGRYGSFRNELAKLGGWKKRKVEKPDYSDPEFENKNYFYNYPYVADLYMQDGDSVEGNFVEVIIFSDCEGFFDTKHCKKLFKDFEMHLNKAEVIWADNPMYFNFYKGLMEAFKFGSENGAVQYT